MLNMNLNANKSFKIVSFFHNKFGHNIALKFTIPQLTFSTPLKI